MQVPTQFVEDFNLVVAHYDCSSDEVEEMKACARADFQAAQRCFEQLAREIRARQTNSPARTGEFESLNSIIGNQNGPRR